MACCRSLLGVCALAASLTLSVAGQARTLVGVVTHVTDGDSLWVRMAEGSRPREVRLQGIDAPEICQVGGREARDALTALALHRQVIVATRARDRYDRIVARVFVGSQDLGAAIVASGWAWSDGYRGSGGPYARQQQFARSRSLGLWRDSAPMPPRDFRRRHGRCH
jgi:micrococcal nuclease